MKKSVFITIIVAILIVSGILLSRDSKDSTTPSSEINNPSESVTTEELSGVGRYTAYSPETLANSDYSRKILFFKADWCPSCRALDKDIEENLDKIPEDTIIMEVDYDTETELKQQYKVAAQHTLVVLDSNNEEIEKWSAILSLDELIRFIDAPSMV